jgi:hypothetical protein
MFMQKLSFGAVAVLLGSTAMAHASPILDSIVASGETAKALGLRGAAESFVADSTGIGDVELQLQRTGTSTGSIVITLNANGTNAPGAVLNTIATITASTIPTTETLYDFYNLGITGLTAGTTYWIEVAKGSTGTASVNTFTNTATPAYGSANATYWAGSGSATTVPVLSTCVSDTNLCDVLHTPTVNYAFNQATPTPEPTTMAILGTGLVGLGWSRRRAMAKRDNSQ